jgi:hypothetical protein
MKTTRPSLLAVTATAFFLAAFVGQANATVTFSSSGTVASPDFTATFDSLLTGDSLASYNEDGISITVSDTAFPGFQAFTPGDLRASGFHYGSGGNFSYVTIRLTDGSDFAFLQLLLGDGYSGTLTTNLRWQAYLDGNLLSSGLESGLAKGSTVGWTALTVFDELRIAAGVEASPGFGNLQAIAIDDVSLALIPEPSSHLLITFGALAAVSFRRRS